MSALSYLCDYSSEDSDTELEPNCKRPKFPSPNLSGVPVVASEVHNDDPELHGGRLRSFAHVRGNWATFVYVNYSPLDEITELIEELQETVSNKIGSCQKCDDLHISLSRTVVLKFHLISPFIEAIQKGVQNCDSFDLLFGPIKVFTNEENSRTFIALDVDPFSRKHLVDLSKKVDEVLTEFQLPIFYEDPSFHMSILWVNGDKKKELNSILDLLSNNILLSTAEKYDKSVLVNSVSCKIGNKYFKYILQ